MEIKDLTGLSRPLEKFIKTISKGIGHIFTPYIIKRNALADLHVINEISKTIENNPLSIKEAEYARDGLIVKYSSDNIETVASQILERAKSREEFKSIKKQNNIERIISQTAADLDNDEDISNEEVDEDWIN